MIHSQEFEDKVTKELIKIVPYNLQTSIRLSLFSKDVKAEQSFNSSGSLFHKLAALNNTGLSEISRNITIFRHTCDGIWYEQHYWSTINYYTIHLQLYFQHVFEIKPKLNDVSNPWWLLNRGDNNERTLISYFGTLITGPLIGGHLMKM